MKKVGAIFKLLYYGVIKGIFPSLVVLGGVLYFMLCYQRLFLDTFNIYNFLGTILMLPLGVFVAYIAFVLSFSYFKLSSNIAISTLRGEGWSMSVYRAGNHYFLDENGGIGFGKLFFGLILSVLMVPFSIITWIIGVIRILLSVDYADTVLSSDVNDEKSNFFYIMLAVSIVSCGLGIGVKALQDHNYNPYFQTRITSITTSEDNSKGYLHLVLEETKGSNAIKFEVSIQGYYEDRLLIDTSTFSLHNDGDLRINISFSLGDNYYNNKKIGFDKFDYYMTIEEAVFELGTIYMFDNPYVTKIN